MMEDVKFYELSQNELMLMLGIPLVQGTFMPPVA